MEKFKMSKKGKLFIISINLFMVLAIIIKAILEIDDFYLNILEYEILNDSLFLLLCDFLNYRLFSIFFIIVISLNVLTAIINRKDKKEFLSIQ